MQDAPSNGVFSGPITHLLSMLYIVIKLLSPADTKKKAKRIKGFKLGTFIGRFQVTSWQ